MRILLSLLFLFLLVTTVESNPYEYRVLRVIDGDTVEIEANYLPKELGNKIHLRILGVDTPEKGSKAHCVLESFKAENATLFTKVEIEKGKDIKIIIKKWDKYGGRIIGDVMIDGELLSKKLLDKGYALEYTGKGNKPNWC